MTQEEINKSEWNNLNNWRRGIFYHSKSDNRTFVDKRKGFGVTVNFGNRNGVIIFLILLAQPLVIFAALWLAGFHFGRR